MSNKKYCVTHMEADLRTILVKRKIEKGQPFTHTTKSPAGSYYIAEEDYEEFITKYSSCINKGVRPTVTERPGAYGPLRVDFDLKATLDQGLKRQYTKTILESIVKYYQEEIKNAVDEEEFTDKTLTCIVLEKKAPRVEEGKVKDGFHLHFPHFICEGWFQDEYLRSKVTEKMIINKLWTGCKFMEPVEKFIDTGMAKKQWLMYGSAKAEGAEPFLATRAYDLDMKEITLETVFEEEIIGRKMSARFYLPRFLSIRGYNQYTTLKPQTENKKTAYRHKKSRKVVVTKKRTVEEVLADIQLIKQAEFMGMLSDDRADTYNTWLEVGYVLFNIGQGCDEALQLWIDFSKRSSKFVDGECEEQWGKMKMGDYTIGSIKFMAQRDDPTAYNEWKSMDLRTQLMKSIQEAKPNEWDVAQVVLCMYRDIFKCADSKHDVWAQFADHRWRIVDDQVAIRLKIPTEVKEEYVKLKAYEATRQIGMDESEKSKSEKIEKKCLEMITALKTCSFQDKVLKTCKGLFHDPQFMKKLNENRMLFGCENGVIDLGAMLFRDGRPDDYITFSCGLNYQTYNENDDDVIELRNLTKKVFTNPNLENYFLDAACATLQGGNVNKTFIVGTGDGDNAKSVMYGLLEKVFGEYCIKFPRELLIVGKGASSSGPRPELARVRGKRIAMVQEIAKTDVLNIGVLKELTGNDSFFARGMYEKDATEVVPQFSLWMQCLREGTPVSIPAGFSMPIETLYDNENVLSWGEEEEGIVVAKQKKFLNQGKRDCVTLTLLDGTEITCTPEHRFLDAENGWVEAGDIELQNKVTMSAHSPVYTDLTEDTKYDLGVSGIDLSSLEERLKAMAVCRLLGYGLADGTLNTALYAGHILDAKTIVGDIKLVTGKSPAITKTNNCFMISIPSELSRTISKLCPPQKGGRINNPMVLPEFIFDESCPEFLIRETVAGMFGGDGIIPCLVASGDNRIFSPLLYIASKRNDHIPSLVEQLERVVVLLKTRFDIDSYVAKPREYEKGKSKVLLNIRKIKSIRNFIEKIGVRYCCHKAYRLTAVLSFYKYKQSIIDQNKKIVERTIDLVEKYKKQNPRPQIQQYSLDGDLLATFDSTQKAQHSTGIHHSSIKSACKRNDASKSAKSSTAKGYIWKHLHTTSDKEEEPGCATIKKAYVQAISEEHHIFNKSKLVNYTQVISRILKGDAYTVPQIGDILEEYLKITGLLDFCNDQTGTTKYSVGADSESLPCYYMPVIGRKNAGKHQVYDLTIEEPYSNYIANGIVSHNCNEPPKVPGQDEATWNRIRILSFESKFVKAADIHKWPVPETEEEQIKAKRFKADTNFSRRLPDIAPVLLWLLFERYKDYKKYGLREPTEVHLATNIYRASNDIYIQFIEELIERDPVGTKEPSFLKLNDLFAEFTSWFAVNHSSYAREKITKIVLLHEMSKRFGAASKQGKNVQGWYGYKIIEEDAPPEADPHQQLQEILAGKKIKA